ncbi:MAG: hypothetical protein ABF289_08210 [Clostridiales bacterium]
MDFNRAKSLTVISRARIFLDFMRKGFAIGEIKELIGIITI